MQPAKEAEKKGVAKKRKSEKLAVADDDEAQVQDGAHGPMQHGCMGFWVAVFSQLLQMTMRLRLRMVRMGCMGAWCFRVWGKESNMRM